MENYIDGYTIVANEIYLSFKEDVVCPICSNILIEPQMCTNCQNVYCRKCLNEWTKKSNQCPNRCDTPNYITSKEKLNIISKLKFKCKKCGEQISHEQMEKHISLCNPNNNKKKKVKRLKDEDLERVKLLKGIPHITSKNYKKILFIFLLS